MSAFNKFLKINYNKYTLFGGVLLNSAISIYTDKQGKIHTVKTEKYNMNDILQRETIKYYVSTNINYLNLCYVYVLSLLGGAVIVPFHAASEIREYYEIIHNKELCKKYGYLDSDYNTVRTIVFNYTTDTETDTSDKNKNDENDVHDEKYIGTITSINHHLNDKNQIKNQINNEINNEIKNQINNEIKNQINNEINNQINNEINNEIKNDNPGLLPAYSHSSDYCNYCNRDSHDCTCASLNLPEYDNQNAKIWYASAIAYLIIVVVNLS